MKQYVIKRSDGKYFAGIPSSFGERLFIYVDAQKDALHYTEYDKDYVVLLMKGEEWEEAVC